jgi:hypothetical protein
MADRHRRPAPRSPRAWTGPRRHGLPVLFPGSPIWPRHSSASASSAARSSTRAIGGRSAGTPRAARSRWPPRPHLASSAGTIAPHADAGVDRSGSRPRMQACSCCKLKRSRWPTTSRLTSPRGRSPKSRKAQLEVGVLPRMETSSEHGHLMVSRWSAAQAMSDVAELAERGLARLLGFARRARPQR